MATQKQKKFTGFRIAGTSVAAVALAFVLGLNVSSAFAATMRNIPLIGSAAKFLTFREYEKKTDTYAVQIDTAKISGMGNGALETALNEKYMEQSKRLYNEFMSKIKAGDENIGLFSNYTVKADNGVTVSIENAVTETAASGYEKLAYDTLDVKNERYITLKSLFVDDSYIDVISKNISEQISAQMSADAAKVYFTNENKFKAISGDQAFYINNDNKLVVAFDEYAIAPGYMGTVEFMIPTEALRNILVSGEYIH
ncbi:MAG: RsiV family protein [Clostridiales Family XIII bacterium]|nr:RsiV family protein [Clostridiales Family XIII bacterium]